VRAFLGIVAMVAGAVCLFLGLRSEGLADSDVLLICLGAGLLLIGIRMFLKGALAMVILIVAIVVIVAGPFVNLLRD
jgi:hypothetical protein